MNVRNCTRCGKIYNYDGFKVCPTCRKDDEKDFQKVKEYLYENPGANIPEVSEATEVDAKKIIDFLRAGRLEIADDSNLILECENCGTSIRTGRFCDKCASGLQRDLGQVLNTAKPQNPYEKREEKFRVIDRYGKRK